MERSRVLEVEPSAASHVLWCASTATDLHTLQMLYPANVPSSSLMYYHPLCITPYYISHVKQGSELI